MQQIKLSLLSTWIVTCFIITLIGVSWSLFHPGLFHVHDSTHAARISQLNLALHDGHFPVRWVKDFGAGYGMPLFEFYAPLPYYAGALLLFIGLPMEWVIKALYLISSAAVWWSAYYLGRQLTRSPAGGVLAAIGLTLAPYRAVNLFVRGALSESWGMIGSCLLLAGVVTLTQDKSKAGGWLLGSGIAVLLLSHNLTAIMILPFALIFGLGWLMLHRPATSSQWRTCFQITLIAGLLGLGLTAFYVLPLLAEKQFVNLDNFARSFPYRDHFVYSIQLLHPFWGFGASAPPPYNDQSHFLGYGQMILFGLGALVSAGHSWRERHLQPVLEFSLVALLLGLSLFLLHPRSAVVWETLPWLPMLQFPWRWLGIATIFLSLGGAWVVHLVPTLKLKMILVSLAGLGLLLSNFGYFKPESYLADSNEFYFTDPLTIHQKTSPGFIDYLPPAVDPYQPADQLLSAAPGVNWQVVENKTQSKKLTLSLAQAQLVEFKVAAFPGWQVLVNKQLTELVATTSGLVAINLPAGTQAVDLRFRRTPARVWGDSLSLLSLGGVIYLARQKNKHAQT